MARVPGGFGDILDFERRHLAAGIAMHLMRFYDRGGDPLGARLSLRMLAGEMDPRGVGVGLIDVDETHAEKLLAFRAVRITEGELEGFRHSGRLLGRRGATPKHSGQFLLAGMPSI